MSDGTHCPVCGLELMPGMPKGICPRCAFTEALQSTRDALIPGAHVGRYKLLEKIGEGGCGVVYMAEQEEPVRRKVAIKIIKLGMDTKVVIARFEAERQALALMEHPNIAKVLDAGATETGRPYFVMEMVRGIRITDYCDQHNLTTRARLELFTQVCHAVQHAHQKGIIHRDIKPSNILVTLHDGEPVPKVIDFGIAKATCGQKLTDKTLFTAFEQFMGTPAYMSPEQAEMSGLDIDTRSDIYSLGVLLYELLTGETPFDARKLLASGLAVMRQTIREREPARPSTRLSTMLDANRTQVAKLRRTEPRKLITLLRGDLDWIVMKTLEKDRTRRYESASDLAADIYRHLGNEAVSAGPPSDLYRFRKWVHRNKLVFVATSAVVAALVLGLGASLWQSSERGKAFRRALAAEKEQEILRQRAETEASRAGSAEREAKVILAASDLAQAIRLLEQGEAVDALPYLVRSVKTYPANRAALTRLTSLLTQHSWMLPTLDLKHDGIVTSAQFSPDGKRIATASLDKTARVWDAQTGQPLTDPLTHSTNVTSVQFSPDGKLIATISLRAVRVWDAQSGEPIAASSKHSTNIALVQFASDSKRLLTISWDKAARLWDVQTGQVLVVPLQYGATESGSIHRWLSCTQLNPDGKRIITATLNEARVYDVETGRPLTEPLKHDHWVESARFSPDGTRIVTSSDDKTARLWDAQTGRPIMEPLKHDDFVHLAQFSPDGKRVITASGDQTVRIWDAETGLPLIRLSKHGRSVESADFSLDGKRIITISRDRMIHLWDARTGELLAEPFKHGERTSGGIEPVSARFSADGRRVLTSSRDQKARVWEMQPRQSLCELLPHGELVSTAQFSADGKHILATQPRHTLSELSLHGERVYAAQFGSDSRLRMAFSRDLAARLWDTQSFRPVADLHDSNAVCAARFSADSKRVITASWDKRVRVWDAQTRRLLLPPLPHDHIPLSAQFSPDGTRILSGGFMTKVILVWDAQTGKLLTEPLRHESFVISAQFSPDGKRIITATTFDLGRVWDAQNGRLLSKPLRHGALLKCAEFNHDWTKAVAVSLVDGTASVWDARTGQPLTAPLKHRGTISAACFSPDGSRVVTASQDQTVCVWDAETGQALMEPLKHGTNVITAEFSPDGRRIVTVAADHVARVWDIVAATDSFPEWLLELGEAISGQTLNNQGMLEATKRDRVLILQQVRQKLDRAANNDDWVVWGRWHLSDPANRTIAPFSKVKSRNGPSSEGDQK